MNVNPLVVVQSALKNGTGPCKRREWGEGTKYKTLGLLQRPNYVELLCKTKSII
jgi:hypothetical protein